MKLKKNSKKGFTIVELVIVIAVIAILAAVLIPTFTGLVEKANKNAALTEAKNNMTNDLINANADYTNMQKYIDATESTTIAYYIVVDKATYGTSDTPETGAQFATIAGTAVSVVASITAAGDYYQVAAYAGFYNGLTWVDEVNGYTCTFDVASGTWTVD